MESKQTQANSGQTQPAGDSPRRRCACRGRGGVAAILLVMALVVGAAGVWVGKSFAHGFGPFAGRSSIVSADPAKLEQRVERMVGRFAARVDATPEQRQKLQAIAADAAKELAPLRSRLQAARKQAIGLLGAASVDHAAIERLRAEQFGLADTASQRLAKALADAAEVLTPEQREKLAARAGERMERWERSPRG